jgi:nucleoside-triphosphatase THEP1
MVERSLYIFIITGNPGCGKTSFLNELLSSLRKRKITVRGFLAPSSSQDKQSQSYEIQNIETGERLPLASRKYSAGWIRTGNFYFNPEAIRAGKKMLNNPGLNKHDLVVMDEIGPFELGGKIWADSLSDLLFDASCHMILVVRKSIIKEVIQKWGLGGACIIDIEKVEVHEAENLIILQLKPGDSVHL